MLFMSAIVHDPLISGLCDCETIPIIVSAFYLIREVFGFNKEVSGDADVGAC